MSVASGWVVSTARSILEVVDPVLPELRLRAAGATGVSPALATQTNRATTESRTAGRRITKLRTLLKGPLEWAPAPPR